MTGGGGLKHLDKKKKKIVWQDVKLCLKSRVQSGIIVNVNLIEPKQIKKNQFVISIKVNKA